MPEIGRLALPCDQVVDHLTALFQAEGMHVTRSFDLLAARRGLIDPESCPCPSHGTSQCTCQYVVLLVNLPDTPPESVVAHGHGDHTVISLPALEHSDNSQLIAEMLQTLMTEAVARE